MPDPQRKRLSSEGRHFHGRGPTPVQDVTGGLRNRSGQLAAPQLTSVPQSLAYTPESSSRDPEPEHQFREEVGSAVRAQDFTGAQSSIGLRLRERRYPDTALHLLGIVRLCQGDTSTARDCLVQALRLRQEFDDLERRVSTRTALARVEMEGTDFPRAWEHLDFALALDPLSLHVHWNRLCLARAHLAHNGPGDQVARDRVESACSAMAGIDPGWSDDGASTPFLLSLK